MTEAHFHLVQSGDSPNQNTMRCEASGCGFRVTDPDRTSRMIAAYHHIAEVMANQKEQDAS